jgi:Zn finger protein HypA/HybF involved in hydrogenase expression
VKNDMHDTILLSKISESLKEACIANKIKKVNTLTVVINHRSHVNSDNLYEHLQYANKNLVGKWTKINVMREEIQDQTAILKSIEGEQSE